MGRFPLGVFVAVAAVVVAWLSASPAFAQWTYTIDATPLSADVIEIDGVSYPNTGAQVLTLADGPHTVGYRWPNDLAVTLPFTVSGGAVSVGSGFSGFVSISGSSLVVSGVTHIFRNLGLAADDLQLTGYGPVPAPSATYLSGKFLPGLHRLSYATGVGTPRASVDYTINSNGRATYNGVYEGILQGNGGGAFDFSIHGALITINNSSLSAPDVRISGIYPNSPAPHATFTVALLPGAHQITYDSSDLGQDASTAFSVVAGSSGATVSYAASQQGVLLGAGTSTLTIQGRAVTVDNSFLSSPQVRFGGVYDSSAMPASLVPLNLLPGEHDIGYESNPIGPDAATSVAVNSDGTVAYDPADEGVLLGAGSSGLTLRGADLVIDNSYLYATNVELHGFGVGLDNDTTIQTLLPGVHAVQYAASPTNPPARVLFDVDAAGAAIYDPILEGAVLGFGTNILRLPGLEVRAAVPEWGAGSAQFFANPFLESCERVRLLPGWHNLGTIDPSPDAVEFLVLAGGVIDFDPSFDADWAGRGTNVLAQRDGAGVPQVCNQPPVAIVDPADITVEATSAAGAFVSLDGLMSFDPENEGLTYHWDVSDVSVVLSGADTATPSGVFAIGTTMATLTVTDPQGAYSTADAIIRVVDTTPPAVTCSTDMATLWPPNHKMKVVELQVIIEDIAGSAHLLSATLRSDEPDDAPGGDDGNTSGDVNGGDGFAGPVDVADLFVFDPSRGTSGAWVASVLLRGERAGSGDGRVYTLDVVAIDEHMNITECSTCVIVPKSRGHN
ncbi:MAG: hypothetical protein R3B68_12440 [Phycisphaerales bacterium]